MCLEVTAQHHQAEADVPPAEVYVCQVQLEIDVNQGAPSSSQRVVWVSTLIVSRHEA